MLFAHYTEQLSQRVGVEKAVNMLADAGFPAVDITMQDEKVDPPFCSDWRAIAKRLKSIAKERGITFIQGHAPVGCWEHYINDIIPMMPNVFELAGILEIPNLVVHPIMRGYYYDDKARMFEEILIFTGR